MASTQIELNPVKSITTGFIGQPGKRVFYLQAHGNGAVVTLIVEKQQMESLANGIETFLEELHEKFPERFTNRHTNKGNVWLIRAPEQ